MRSISTNWTRESTAENHWKRLSTPPVILPRDTTNDYAEALMAQSPEILDIVEWTKVPMDDWLTFSILLRNTIVEMVNRLLQNTR